MVNHSILRDSNIELLRIVCMFYIVTLHIVGIGLTFLTGNGDADLCKLTIESFAIVGVNCFILISGYFGISLNLLSISKFILQCCFYSILIFFIVGLIVPETITMKTAVVSFFPFGHMTWWFITPYLCLCLFSPILNWGINRMESKAIFLSLIILLYINLYLGFLWGNEINKTGYTIFQFILLYFIGRFVRLQEYKLNRFKSLGIYVLSCIVLSFLSFNVLQLTENIEYLNRYVFSYNNPIVLVASISFFLFWISFRFKSRYINYVSSGVFSVYLIHMHPSIQPFFFGGVKELDSFFLPYNIVFKLSIWMLIIILFLLICSNLDHLRIKMMSKVDLYFASLINKVISKVYSLFDK